MIPVYPHAMHLLEVKWECVLRRGVADVHCPCALNQRLEPARKDRGKVF